MVKICFRERVFRHFVRGGYDNWYYSRNVCVTDWKTVTPERAKSLLTWLAKKSGTEHNRDEHSEYTYIYNVVTIANGVIKEHITNDFGGITTVTHETAPQWCKA